MSLKLELAESDDLAATGDLFRFSFLWPFRFLTGTGDDDRELLKRLFGLVGVTDLDTDERTWWPFLEDFKFGDCEREQDDTRCFMCELRDRTGGGVAERDADEWWRFLDTGELMWRMSRDDGRRGGLSMDRERER